MSGLSVPDLAFYAAVLLGAFAIRSAAGFGAGLIAIPLLAFILPVSTAVAVATVLTTLTSVQLVGRDWRRIAWPQFLLIFLYSMAGIGLGLYFLRLLNEDLLRHSLGVFLILYAAHALWVPDLSGFVPRQWHGVLAAGAGIIGGLFSALFGAGAGPIYVVYFDILRLERTAFRATMSAVVLLGGVARIAGYGSSGLYVRATIPLLAIGLPIVVLGCWLGDRVVLRLNARSFSRLVAAVVLLSGVTLLIR